MILKARIICVKKVAIVELFQVQNHYNKLFGKTLNKKLNTQYLSRVIAVTVYNTNKTEILFV